MSDKIKRFPVTQREFEEIENFNSEENNRKIEEAKTEKIKCDNCGSFFTIGNKPNGMPNGIGFVLESGKVINYCYDCICQIGKEARKK